MRTAIPGVLAGSEGRDLPDAGGLLDEDGERAGDDQEEAVAPLALTADRVPRRHVHRLEIRDEPRERDAIEPREEVHSAQEARPVHLRA